MPNIENGEGITSSCGKCAKILSSDYIGDIPVYLAMVFTTNNFGFLF